MSRNLDFVPDEYYHIYNRGTEKRNIFQNKKDYRRFLLLLYLCNNEEQIHINNLIHRGRTSVGMFETKDRKPLIEICAYCLMPNHFHLLIKEKSGNGISKFMQKLITGYTMYFNKIHERSGTLFQGKFKAKHIDTDLYLEYLLAYIHLNPVKLIDLKWKEKGLSNLRKTESFLEKYTYSSFLDYSGTQREEGKIINKASLPKYFETPEAFKESLRVWLDNRDEFTEVRPR